MKFGMCFLPVTFEGMEQGISRVVLELGRLRNCSHHSSHIVFVAHVYIYIIVPIQRTLETTQKGQKGCHFCGEWVHGLPSCGVVVHIRSILLSY